MRAVAAVGTTVAGLAAAAITGVAAYAVHDPPGKPRDEAAFLSLVGQPGPELGNLMAYADSHPRLVIAEGDQACAWLKRQPYGPRVDPSGYYEPGAFARRYVAATADRP